jgi:hypothetical protein
LNNALAAQVDPRRSPHHQGKAKEEIRKAAAASLSCAAAGWRVQTMFI